MSPLRRFFNRNSTKSTTTGSCRYSKSTGSQRTKHTTHTNVPVTTARRAEKEQCKGANRKNTSDDAQHKEPQIQMDFLKPESRRRSRRKRYNNTCRYVGVPSNNRGNVAAEYLQRIYSDSSVSSCGASDVNSQCPCDACVQRLDLSDYSQYGDDSSMCKDCDYCAEAGLVRCCHSTPDAAVMRAIMRELNKHTQPAVVPQIQIKVESYN